MTEKEEQAKVDAIFDEYLQEKKQDMREILFRGKREDTGFWVEGYYFKNDKGTIIFTYPYHANFWGVDVVVRVDDESIGQYTGLKDKNEKKIFEGDILKECDVIHEGEIQISGKFYKVEMRKGCWVLSNDETWDFLETNAKTCEIIGNIHENPELLEAKE